MDWIIHPDGGMWMGHSRFVHIICATISRSMISQTWVGHLVIRGPSDLIVCSMDFAEVITELEATIILLEST